VRRVSAVPRKRRTAARARLAAAGRDFLLALFLLLHPFATLAVHAVADLLQEIPLIVEDEQDARDVERRVESRADAPEGCDQVGQPLEREILTVQRDHDGIGRDEFGKPFTSGLNFCGATVLLDAKGLTFDRIDNGGRDGDPDAISTAVPGSLAPVPWAHVPTAQVLLAMDDSRGGPFFADPRQVLRHAMKPLADMGLTAVCATELEFYLLEPGAGVPSPRVGLIPGTR
jgi:hypothetical protein